MAFFLFNEHNAKALLMMRKGDVMTIITNFYYLFSPGCEKVIFLFFLKLLSLSIKVILPKLCSYIEFHAHLACDTFEAVRSDPLGRAQQPYAWT